MPACVQCGEPASGGANNDGGEFYCETCWASWDEDGSDDEDPHETIRRLRAEVASLEPVPNTSPLPTAAAAPAAAAAVVPCGAMAAVSLANGGCTPTAHDGGGMPTLVDAQRAHAALQVRRAALEEQKAAGLRGADFLAVKAANDALKELARAEAAFRVRFPQFHTQQAEELACAQRCLAASQELLVANASLLLRQSSDNGRTHTVSTLITASEARRSAGGAAWDMDEVGADGLPHLVWAASKGFAAIAQALVAAGAAVDATNEEGKTALICASQAGHAQLVHALVAAGADADVVDRHSKTALLWASACGHAHIVRALVKARASQLDTSDEDGKTALMHAVQGKHAQVVQSLLAAGASTNSRCLSGETPLLSATHHGPASTVRELLAAGADVDGVNVTGSTSLILASMAGSVVIVRALLEAGAAVGVVDKHGWNALLIASYKGRTQVVEELVAAGVDPNNAGEWDDKAALELALGARHTATAEALVAAGARRRGERRSSRRR